MPVVSTPKHVDLAITGRCNLICQYCFYADEMTGRTDLPTGRWQAFFEELGQLGVMTACLTGGEVFTRSDLFELIDGLIANRMRYSLLSNGTLITEDVLAQFAIGKRRTRLDSIQVSIDGSQEAIHNHSRPQSFQRALRGLRLLKNAGFPVTVRVTVNHYNVTDLANIARLLLEDVGLSGFSTNDAFACGAAKQAGGTIMLTNAQQRQAMQTLVDLTTRYHGRISAQAGSLVMAREAERIETLLAAGQTGLPDRGTLCSCGGVFTKIAVLHDGTIVPCHNLSPLHLGMIGKDDLRQIWLTHPTMLALRQRRTIPLSTLETCRDCRYQGFCAGGCPGGALAANGDYNTRDPSSCYRIFKGEDPSYP